MFFVRFLRKGSGVISFGRWYGGLSPSERKLQIFAGLLVLVSIISLWIPWGDSSPREVVIEIDCSRSLSHYAKILQIPPKSLARELGKPLNVSKKKPLTELAISSKDLEEAIHHLRSHRSSSGKYFLYVAFSFWGFTLLRNSGKEGRALPGGIRTTSLVLSVFIVGFLTGKSPNPMESVVKVFKAFAGLYNDPLSKMGFFLFFGALAIIGNKIVCGWACPFGALQELIYRCSGKNRKVPFLLSNGMRVILFIGMLLFLFGIVGGQKGFVLYHGINPFNLFNFHLDSLSLKIAVVAYLLASLFLYRPFCSFICPFGLVSWGLEQCSLKKIIIDHKTCTACRACMNKCPNQAMEDRIKKAKLPCDCFSCGNCLGSCSFSSIRYGS